MSHTYKASNGTRFHYNSDLSGDVTVTFCKQDGTDDFVYLNSDDIFDFIAEVVRRQKIAQIEDMTTSELLGDI